MQPRLSLRCKAKEQLWRRLGLLLGAEYLEARGMTPKGTDLSLLVFPIYPAKGAFMLLLRLTICYGRGPAGPSCILTQGPGSSARSH